MKETGAQDFWANKSSSRAKRKRGTVKLVLIFVTWIGSRATNGC